MIVQTQGIVLRQTKFSETSVIVSMYTRALGLQSYIVQGIRKAGAKQKAALLQPGNYLDLEVYHRPGKNLNRIKEMKSAYVFRLIPFDVVRGMLLLFMMEVCNHSIKEEEENETLFEFMAKSLIQLDQRDQNITYFPEQFMMYLTEYLGFQPNYKNRPYFDLVEGSFSNEQPIHPNFLASDSVKLLSDIIQLPTWQIPETTYSKKTRMELLNGMMTYYQLHIHSFQTIKSVQVLRQVMDA